MTEQVTIHELEKIVVGSIPLLDARWTGVVSANPQKRDQHILAYGRVDGDSGSFILSRMKMSENEELRIAGSIPCEEEGIKRVFAENGKEMDLLITKEFRHDPNNTLIYCSFGQKPGPMADEDGPEWRAYLKSEEIIRDGITIEGVDYEFLMASTSQSATGKAVLVRKDYRIPSLVIEAVDDPDMRIRYEEARGQRAFLTMATYGGWMLWEGTMGNPTKTLARAAQVGSSSKVLGRGLKTRVIGTIQMEWCDAIESMFWDQLLENGTKPERAKKVLARIKAKWKKEKWDGTSIVRESTIIRFFKESLGIEYKPGDLVGMLLQVRYAGLKGTVLVVSDDMLDIPILPDGTHPYQGFDLIVEESSWKYNYDATVFKGELAPSLCLISISKNRSSNNMFSMLWGAMDGENNNASKLYHAMKGLARKTLDDYMDALNDPIRAKSIMGLSGYQLGADEKGIDTVESKVTSPIQGAVTAHGPSIRDRSVATKFLNKQLGVVEDRWNGRMPIEGSTRFGITDPTGFFRTDAAVMTGESDMFGNPIFTIIIDDPELLTLTGISECYWGNRDKRALLFRSPCVHHGEPQLVDLVSITGPRIIDYPNGVSLNLTPFFENMKWLLIFSATGYLLEALAGADTDGDKFLVVIDPSVIAMRNPSITTYLAIVPSKAKEVPISIEALREAYIASLNPSQVGQITNWGITIRDIQMMVRSMPGPRGEKVLPLAVQEELVKMGKAARKALMAGTLEDPEDIACCKQVARLEGLENIMDDPTMKKEWGTVIETVAEWLMCLYRRLQETAIGAPKTGIRVDESLYRWARISIRAEWHKPQHRATYPSWSPLGRLQAYVQLEWEKLLDYAVENHHPIEPLINVPISGYEVAYKEIRKIRGEFGSRISFIHRDNPGVDCREMDKEVYEIYRSIVASWVTHHDLTIDVAAALVYKASYDKDSSSDSKKSTKGFTFMWACFGEEIVSALKHLSKEPGTSLIRVVISKELAGYVIQEGLVVVENRKVWRTLNGENFHIGRCSVPDGEYDLYNDKNDQPYIVVNKEAARIEMPKLNLKNRLLPVIGLGRHSLTLDNGDVYEVTKPRALAMLKKANGLCQAVSEIGYKGKPTVYIEILFRGKWIRIGNISTATRKEEDAGFWAMALVDTKFRLIEKEPTVYESSANFIVTDILD